MKKIISLLLTVSISLTIGACSTIHANNNSNSTPNKIVLVQMPNENNPDSGSKHKEFSEALSKEIGIPVEEMEGTSYSVGIEAMANKNIDVMLVSPMSYYQAKERAGAELLVSTPMSSDYRTYFIVKGDSNINSLEDLKGKTFAFVEQASSSGYLYPKAKLVKDLNLETDKLENSNYYFETVAFSGGHPASVMGVIMGDYDGAAVAGAVLDQLIKAGQIKEGDFKVIAQTDIIPNPSYIVRSDLPNELKEKVKNFFLNYDNEAYFETIHGNKAIRFVDVTENDIAPAKEMLDLLKIDLGDK